MGSKKSKENLSPDSLIQCMIVIKNNPTLKEKLEEMMEYEILDKFKEDTIIRQIWNTNTINDNIVVLCEEISTKRFSFAWISIEKFIKSRGNCNFNFLCD